MKLSVIIPVYNEINTFSELVRQVQSVPIDKEIIVIDDGSNDGTTEVIKKIKASNTKVIFNSQNRGKGYCLRKGFGIATGDIIVIQDADLEYYPDEYPLLIKKIIEGKADVVYGNRFLGSRRVFNFYHFCGNKLLNYIANILYNTNMGDLMTCYKAFNASSLDKLNLHADRFGVEAEITAQIFKRGLRVYEVPISYSGRDYDEGKKITWEDFFRSIYWLLKCKFNNYDIGQETLGRMKIMKNYNNWIFNQIKEYLGEHILEIGSGMGNISRLLVSYKKNLLLTDIRKDYLEYLRQRFIGNPKVKVFYYDISSSKITKNILRKIDTIVCINVLEHLKNDRKALQNFHKILVDKGRLIIIVPALKCLYGTLDKKLDHYRRYEKDKLRGKITDSGFTIEKMYYHNFFSSFGWFFNGRIMKKNVITSLGVLLLDKLIPLFAWIEKQIKIPFGLSIIVIARNNRK